MLHLLLLILKITGIILAVILGILVLLVCIVLFVPVCYEASGKCDGTLESLRGRIKITWLFHLVRADASYKNQKLKYRIRIAWIKKTAGGKKLPEEEKEPEITGIKEEEDEEKKKDSQHENGKPESKECESAYEEASEVVESEKEAVQKAEAASQQENTDEKRTGFSEKIEGFIRKIKEFFHRLRCTIQKFCDKIKLLLQKKEKLAEFIRDEAHRGAFQKVKKEIFKLLRRLRPRELAADIRYGFDDPCTTGQVLAGLSILYPFIGEYTNITPDFENRILKGTVHIKGKIRACYFLILCWNLVWCRNVRRTYKDIRNFEL